MEAYTTKPGWVVASAQGEEEGESEGPVAVVVGWDPLAAAVERLTARMERLERESALPWQLFPSKQYGGHWGTRLPMGQPQFGGGGDVGSMVHLAIWHGTVPRTGYH